MTSPFTQMHTRPLLTGERPAARKSERSARTQRAAGTSDEITIRLSTPDDRVAIRRLAQLDGRPAFPGRSILAIVGGELRAALSLGGGDAIADPFWPTTELVELLRVRDAALHETGTAGRRAFRPRIAFARR